jgi:hypothetical protein
MCQYRIFTVQCQICGFFTSTCAVPCKIALDMHTNALKTNPGAELQLGACKKKIKTTQSFEIVHTASCGSCPKNSFAELRL